MGKASNFWTGKFLVLSKGNGFPVFVNFVCRDPNTRVEPVPFWQVCTSRVLGLPKFDSCVLVVFARARFAGLYTLLGAETAQGLPNDQIFYAFLRGGAKQYGTRIWGDASVGNRFVPLELVGGQTSFCRTRRPPNAFVLLPPFVSSAHPGRKWHANMNVAMGDPFGACAGFDAAARRWWGPEGPKECTANAAGTECVCTDMGTSLSLLRRLMYQQLMYNSAIFSFEAGYTCAAHNASLPPIIGL